MFGSECTTGYIDLLEQVLLVGWTPSVQCHVFVGAQLLNNIWICVIQKCCYMFDILTHFATSSQPLVKLVFFNFTWLYLFTQPELLQSFFQAFIVFVQGVCLCVFLCVRRSCRSRLQSRSSSWQLAPSEWQEPSQSSSRPLRPWKVTANTHLTSFTLLHVMNSNLDE